LAIGGAGAVVGYAVVFLALQKAPAPTVLTPPAQPAAPPVLPQPVDVTDVEPLLDPLPGQPVGAPFDDSMPPPELTRKAPGAE
jgi:hypothetical protein